MSKRTLALIIGLVVITGVLLVVALSSQQSPQTPQQTTAVPSLTTPPAHTMLSITKSSQATGNEKNPPLDVRVDSNGDNSTGTQLELAYDPNVITNVKLQPGTLYVDPFVLINNIDQKNGRITYAVAIKPNGKAVNGKGVAATIYYDLMPNAKSTQVSFTFLPKTKTTAEGVATSVLKQTSDYKASSASPTGSGY